MDVVRELRVIPVRFLGEVVTLWNVGPCFDTGVASLSCTVTKLVWGVLSTPVSPGLEGCPAPLLPFRAWPHIFREWAGLEITAVK